MPDSLSGKCAIVTGSGKGVGQGIAIELARCGVNVCIHCHSHADGARETLARVESLGAAGVIVRGDISRPEVPEELVAAAVGRFGRLDILVNNAARQINIPMLESRGRDFDLLTSINLQGYACCAKAAVPELIKSRGVILNVSSIHAKRPTGFDPLYAMTKAGIKMLTREMAVEFAPHGIRVNSLDLGWIEIGVKTGNPPDVPGYIDGPGLIPRAGTMEEAARVARFMVSADASFVDGAGWRVDGGRALN